MSHTGVVGLDIDRCIIMCRWWWWYVFGRRGEVMLSYGYLQHFFYQAAGELSLNFIIIPEVDNFIVSLIWFHTTCNSLCIILWGRPLRFPAKTWLVLCWDGPRKHPSSNAASSELAVGAIDNWGEPSPTRILNFDLPYKHMGSAWAATHLILNFAIYACAHSHIMHLYLAHLHHHVMSAVFVTCEIHIMYVLSCHVRSCMHQYSTCTYMYVHTVNSGY